MWLWRGHVYAVAAVASVIAGLLALIASFRMGNHEDLAWLLVVGIAFLCGVATLVFAALAYSLWIPKWERDERRTGRAPGERGN
jgi:ABC-type amino acid transport system permease subunit